MYYLFRMAQERRQLEGAKREEDTMHRRWRPGKQRQRFVKGLEMSPTKAPERTSTPDAGLSGSNEGALRAYRRSSYHPDLDRIMRTGKKARRSGPLGGT